MWCVLWFFPAPNTYGLTHLQTLYSNEHMLLIHSYTSPLFYSHVHTFSHIHSHTLTSQIQTLTHTLSPLSFIHVHMNSHSLIPYNTIITHTGGSLTLIHTLVWWAHTCMLSLFPCTLNIITLTYLYSTTYLESCKPPIANSDKLKDQLIFPYIFTNPSSSASLIPGSVFSLCRRTTEAVLSQNQTLYLSYIFPCVFQKEVN